MHNYSRSALFLDGAWVEPRGDGMIEVIDPATEQVIGSVPNGNAADVDAAVAAARNAFDPLITLDERRDRLAAVITAMDKRLPEIAETITAEMG
ncbi:MAG TPA: aldehyde dehydrogenase family protein, partial [Mycobacterium sp.]|nr:aldehyde dehydrogenase family protein [Mycobacterium sp.]